MIVTMNDFVELNKFLIKNELDSFKFVDKSKNKYFIFNFKNRNVSIVYKTNDPSEVFRLFDIWYRKIDKEEE